MSKINASKNVCRLPANSTSCSCSSCWQCCQCARVAPLCPLSTV